MILFTCPSRIDSNQEIFIPEGVVPEAIDVRKQAQKTHACIHLIVLLSLEYPSIQDPRILVHPTGRFLRSRLIKRDRGILIGIAW